MFSWLLLLLFLFLVSTIKSFLCGWTPFSFSSKDKDKFRKSARSRPAILAPLDLQASAAAEISRLFALSLLATVAMRTGRGNW